jgi:hypothetical protein
MQNVIALGRAYVRLIEAAQVIMAATEDDMEREDLKALVDDYKQALRELLGMVPATVAADILVASEKVLGPAQENRLN